jgi:hypothetical protein
MASVTGCRRARAGTGPCTKCNCSRFEGRGSVCENCKHHYNEHSIAWPRGLDRPGGRCGGRQAGRQPFTYTPRSADTGRIGVKDSPFVKPKML